MPPLRAALLTALALVVLGLCLGAWAFVIEPASLRVATTTLELRRWPPACDGLRVAVLADLHAGSPFNGLAKLDEIVARTNRERPDLVLLAGDYVVTGIPGGTFVGPEAFAPALGHLEGRVGVFAVLGNHDWWLDGPRVRSALERAGIRVLEDASVRIERGPCSFWLAGIGDYWEAPHDVSAALADVPDAAAILAFTHNPDVFPGIPARVSLSVTRTAVRSISPCSEGASSRRATGNASRSDTCATRDATSS